MLRAIRELGASPVAGWDRAPSADTDASEPAPKDSAERRQVTVMFSDLVGSTALSARMDPEDLREVISAYQKCVAETVQRFGGFVAKLKPSNGDGLDADKIAAVGAGLAASPSIWMRAGAA